MKESCTQGLDNLGTRCAAFYAKGCRFAKWRAILKIDQTTGTPSDLAIADSAHSLARYATICQDNGLVPIVEPDVLTDGAHTIEVCAEVSERVFAACQQALIFHNVVMEGCLLKPNMITPGADCPTRNTHEEIALATVTALNRTIVPAMAGVLFLSGGQSDEDASHNLNEMNKIDSKKRGPWALSFSYGRALQNSALKAWSGKPENLEEARRVFISRCKANGDATEGKFTGAY